MQPSTRGNGSTPRSLAALAVSAALILVGGCGGGDEALASSDWRGKELYGQQCALCHGANGEADGPAAYLLFPPARDFSRGNFKLTSTKNGVPTDDDLVATLRRGIPGSAMPSWGSLPDSDLKALARYVRELAVEGIAARLDGGVEDGMIEPDIREQAVARMTPGEPLEIGTHSAPTEDVLARGRESYELHCASCHGLDGKGSRDALRDVDDTLNWARDFTAGILMRGGSFTALSTTLKSGLHGTAMPGVELSDSQHSALVAYVRTLIPPGSEGRLVQKRRTIRAERVGELTAADKDAGWAEAPETTIALAPLWWRDASIREVRVSALHDGSRVALRLRWADSTPDAPEDLVRPLQVPPYTDAVAVQLSSETSPPFFGMGEGLAPTNIWHWRAIEFPSATDYLPLMKLFPHRVGDWLAKEALHRAPYYQTARGPVRVSGEVASAVPAGMQLIDEQEGLENSIAALPTWDSGTWEVIFTRALDSRVDAELALRPGDRFGISLAIWNGSVQDIRGQKSMTIWHEFELAE